MTVTIQLNIVGDENFTVFQFEKSYDDGTIQVFEVTIEKFAEGVVLDNNGTAILKYLLTESLLGAINSLAGICDIKTIQPNE